MDLSEGIGLSQPLRRAVPVAAAAVRDLLAERHGRLRLTGLTTKPPPREGVAGIMCLGIPGQVVEILADYGDQLALVDVQGAQRRINLGLLEPDQDALNPATGC